MEDEYEELMKMVQRAHNAGDTDSARRLADEANKLLDTDGRKSLASGAMRGAAETVDLGASITDRILNLPLEITQKLGLLELFRDATGIDMGSSDDIVIPQRDPEAPTVRSGLAEATGGFSEYQPLTTRGEFGRTVGQFAGGAAVLPIGGPLRSIVSSLVPALGSETAGQLTEGSEYENLARFAGALGFPTAQALSTPVLRRMVKGPSDEIAANLTGSTRPQSVQTLNQAGVTDITAGQKIGSPNLMRLDGGQDASLIAKQQLTQSVLRQAGANADLASPEVLNATRTRIGKVFDMVDDAAGGVPTQAEANAMLSVLSKAEGDMSIGKIPPALEKIVLDFSEASLDGKAISSQNIRSVRAKLNKAMTKYLSDTDMISYELAFDIKNVLDDMVLRQIPNALKPSLQNAQNQYRAYLTLERAINRSGGDSAAGLITPSALATATRRREGTSYVRGTGSEMGDIARASQEVLSPMPSVMAGGERFVGNLPFKNLLGVVPRTYANMAQETLPLSTSQAVFPSLFERIARQTGGLLNIN
jgi:hypothetical protein